MSSLFYVFLKKLQLFFLSLPQTDAFIYHQIQSIHMKPRKWTLLPNETRILKRTQNGRAYTSYREMLVRHLDYYVIETLKAYGNGEIEFTIPDLRIKLESVTGIKFTRSTLKKWLGKYLTKFNEGPFMKIDRFRYRWTGNDYRSQKIKPPHGYQLET